MTNDMLRLLPLAAPVCLLAAAAWPQDPARESTRPAAVSITKRAHGVVLDGAAWRGGGTDFSVRFADGGIEFTPALGRAAPRTHSLRFTTVSIRRDSVVVYEASPVVDAPVAEREGNTVGYRRGAGVLERYDVRADGVEQSFTFDRPLPGRGDLVVRGRIETELATPLAAAVRSTAGLTFAAAAGGGVHVGAVTGLDAAGNRATGALRFEDGHLELALPARFVDTATYPLVLDPLIGTRLGFGATGTHQKDIDAAYDATRGWYYVAWVVWLSSLQTEIRAQVLRSDGSFGNLIFLAAPAGLALHPAVASVNQTSAYLIVWQEGPSLFGPWDIVGRAWGQGGSPPITIAGTSSNEIEPDASGEMTTATDEAVVVWRNQNGGLWAARVRVPYIGLASVVATAQVNLLSNMGKFAISKSGGAAGRNLVVWERLLPTFTEIDGQVVDRNLARLGPSSTVISTRSDVSNLAPDVDGDGDRFLVAWQQQETTGAIKHDIYCRLMSWNTGLGRLIALGPPTPVEANSDHDELEPAVGLLGPKYLVAFASRAGFGFNHDIVLQALSPENCQPCGRRVWLQGSENERAPRIAPQFASGGSGDAALVTYTAIDTAPPFAGEVVGQLFEALGDGGRLVTVSGACGGGGTASVVGPIVVGNPAFRFTLRGADRRATVAAFHLNAPTTSIRCGSCSILPPLVAISSRMAVGSADLVAPIPCNTALIGAQLDSQWLVGLTALSPCPLAPNISASNTTRMTVGL